MRHRLLRPVIAVVSAVLVSGAVTVLPASPAAAAGGAGFTDLGAMSTLGDVVGISTDDQVAVTNGYWADGTFTPVPTVPLTGDTPTVAGITGDGTVIVDDEDALSDGAVTNPPEFYAWTPSQGGGLTAFPAVCVTSGNFSEYPDDFVSGATTDDGNEVAFANPGCTAIPSGDGVTINGTSGSYAPIGLRLTSALNSSFAFGRDEANKSNAIINRTTNAITDVTIAGTLTGENLTDDGTLAGNLVGTNSLDYTHAETLDAQGVATPLAIPSGQQAAVQSINDNHTVVGAMGTSITVAAVSAVEWPTPTSAPVDLNTDPNVPANWKLATAIQITADGLVLGEGFAPDASIHDYLLQTAPILTVNSTSDSGLKAGAAAGVCDTGSTVTDDKMNSVPECTLRAAIQAANAEGGDQTINFGIPGSATRDLITLTSALPAVTASVTIDGTSQPSPNSAGDPPVAIIGSGLPAGSDGLDLQGGDSTLKDVIMTGFSGSAVVLDGDSGDEVSSNLFGPNVVGGADGQTGNAIAVEVKSGDATVSNNLMYGGLGGNIESRARTTLAGLGKDSGLSTVIKALGKLGSGVLVDSATASGLTLTGNRIGAQESSDFDTLGNAFGVLIFPDTGTVSDLTIGGTGTQANTITGNLFGVAAIGAVSHLTISGNSIGTVGTESGALGNLVGVMAASGSSAMPGLVVSDNRIESNFIGANISGSGVSGARVSSNIMGASGDLSNLSKGFANRNLIGVLLSDAHGVTVGGSNAEGNQILSNLFGVYESGQGGGSNVVSGNTIGFDQDGPGTPPDVSLLSGKKGDFSLDNFASIVGVYDKNGTADAIGTSSAGNDINGAVFGVLGDDTTKLHVEHNAIDDAIFGATFDRSAQLLLGGAGSAGNRIISSILGVTLIGGQPDTKTADFLGVGPDPLKPAVRDEAVSQPDADIALGTAQDVSGVDLDSDAATDLDAGSSADATIEGNAIGAAGAGNDIALADVAPTSGSDIVGNIVSHNRYTGMLLAPDSKTSEIPTGVTFRSNRVWDNEVNASDASPRFSGLGIDLSGRPSAPLDLVFGPNPNHAGGEQLGAPNGYENYPDIATAAPQGSKLATTGTISTDKDSKVVLEFFTNQQCNVSGYGEGQNPVGTVTLTTNSSGSASYAVLLHHTVDLATDRYLTATATELTGGGVGDTSEFSACTSIQPAAAGVAPVTPTVAPDGDLQLSVDCASSSACTGTIDLTGDSAAEPHDRQAADHARLDDLLLTLAGKKIAAGHLRFHLRAHHRKKITVRLTKASRRALTRYKTLTLTAVTTIAGKHHKKIRSETHFAVFAAKHKKKK